MYRPNVLLSLAVGNVVADRCRGLLLSLFIRPIRSRTTDTCRHACATRLCYLSFRLVMLRENVRTNSSSATSVSLYNRRVLAKLPCFLVELSLKNGADTVTRRSLRMRSVVRKAGKLILFRWAEAERRKTRLAAAWRHCVWSELCRVAPGPKCVHNILYCCACTSSIHQFEQEQKLNPFSYLCGYICCSRMDDGWQIVHRRRGRERRQTPKMNTTQTPETVRSALFLPPDLCFRASARWCKAGDIRVRAVYCSAFLVGR